MNTLFSRFLKWLTTNPDLPQEEETTKAEPVFEKELTDIEKAKLFFQELSQSFDIRVFSSDNAKASLSTPISRIDKYIAELLFLTLAVDRNGDIVTTLPLLEREVSVTLRSFFETTEGTYALPEMEGIEFAKANLKFLEMYESLEARENKSYSEQRNLRLIRPLVRTIVTQSKELKPWTSERQNGDLTKMYRAERQTAS